MVGVIGNISVGRLIDWGGEGEKEFWMDFDGEELLH